MKTIWERIVTAAIAGTMVVSLVACSTPPNDAKNKDDKAANNTLFEPGTEISMVVGSHPSWPYNENWPMWKYFREATGVQFDVRAIPTSDIQTKIALMMSTQEDLPDLIYIDGKKLADQYAMQGALVAIDDHMDLMVNYKKFWDTIPEDDREERLMQRRSADGKTYYPQNYGTDTRQGIRAWMYRKDIFEKHTLAVPETMDELFDVSIKLKQLYPNSYPFCLREGLRNIGVIGSLWKPYFTWETYYDFNSETWNFGAIEPTMLEMVKYMRKMYENALLPPDYLTINVKSWEELMSTDRGFVLADFAVRVDGFNTPLRKEHPEYTLAAMVPPKPGISTATTMVNKFNVDPKGYMICNTGNEKRIENALRLVDWMYSDEAAQILSWGKEGETYEIVDNRKSYIRPENGDLEGTYGVFSYGTYLRIDPEAATGFASDEQAKAVQIALDHTIEKYNPALWIAFTDEEKQKYEILYDSIRTYVEEQLSKFLLCVDPLSKWDNYVKEAKKLGIPEILSLYEAAYARVK